MSRHFEINQNDDGPFDSTFNDGLAKTLIRQPDFTGIGGHGPEIHGPHGFHKQLDIGIGDTTVDIRVPLPEPDHWQSF